MEARVERGCWSIRASSPKVSGGWSVINSIVSPSLEVTYNFTEPDTITKTRSPGSPSWKISWCLR
jgi:hypothetical protein